MKVSKRLLMLFMLLAAGSVLAAPTNDGLYATLQTTMGDVCFKLYYTNVPRTVANFVSLAEGTRPWLDPRDSFVSSEPYYNGSIFHRVISNFMIQCGSPKKDGSDGPGYTFEDEFDPALRHDRPGIVSMANAGPDSNGGQFFITVAATPWLNDVHSVFGIVVEGMNVVSNIAAVATNVNSRPLVDVTITNAFITRNGTNAQNFAVTNQLLPEVMSLPIAIARNNGIKISTGTATSSYQYVYSSTNLSGWTEYDSDYWVLPDGAREISPPAGSRGYFHAARVVYNTPNTNTTANPANHHLVMTMIDDGTVIQITPRTNNSGTVKFNNFDDDNIVSWSWDKEPYRAILYVETDYPDRYYFYLHYTTATNGRCVGYYNYSGWEKLGNGTFTDQDLN